MHIKPDGECLLLPSAWKLLESAIWRSKLQATLEGH